MRDKNQVILPLDLEICIPKDDHVFLVAEICESLDYTRMHQTYLKTWRKVNPITMFELLVFGYIEHIYSARELERVCHTDIRFMWLLGNEKAPSHSSISRFIEDHLKNVIEDLFYQFVQKLYEVGEIKYKNLFVDGTKIEAYANRYSFVWKSVVEKNLEKIYKKIENLLPVLVNRYELSESFSCEECYEILTRQAQWLNLTFVAGKGKHKTQLQRDIEALEELLNKKEEYLKYIRHLTGRKSLSKTDMDATFMHMKEDHMRNGQLKPGYNIQIGVESEYIVALGAFSNRNDVQTLIPFLNRIKSHTGRLFERIIADAGYESSENYVYLEENRQECFIKPQNYEISKKRTYKTNPYLAENMEYDAKRDEYICPGHKRLKFVRERSKTTENGYTSTTKIYCNKTCGKCPHRSKCHKSKNNYRTMQVNTVLTEYRKQTLANITGDMGTLLRMNRSIQVEGVFGILKENYGFRRFQLRGKKSIETQMFLFAFAFNIEKLCHRTEKGRKGQDLFLKQAI